MSRYQLSSVGERSPAAARPALPARCGAAVAGPRSARRAPTMSARCAKRSGPPGEEEDQAGGARGAAGGGPPREQGSVFDAARRSKARHRRAGGAPGLVEPAPTLLVERHERLAEQERQPAVGRFVDRHEVVMPATHRRELAVPHGAAHLPGAALTRRGVGVAVAARPAPGTSGPSTSTPIATCLIGVPP